jgi:Tfp pilus assembly protein FimV
VPLLPNSLKFLRNWPEYKASLHLDDRVRLKPVCLLLSLCCAGSAYALGLGDLSVRSALGQPLHVTVALLGTTAETAAACFSLEASQSGVVPLPRAQLSLQSAGEQTLLHIRTQQPVNEPVAQFVLVSDCEARLQREYTVLLDPPELVARPSVAQAPASAAPAAADSTADAAPGASTPRRRIKHPALAAATPGAHSRQPAAHGARDTRTDTTPRLVLSGKRDTRGAQFALRFDTNLPDLSRTLPEGLTATELSDENTALSRKLAHLEAQLLDLQQRNQELESRRPQAPANRAAPPKRPAQWPYYLLVIGLITAGIALAVWLLRRSRAPQPVLMDDSPWTHPAAPMGSSFDMAPAPEPEPHPAPEPERMLEMSEPPRDEGTELKEDILDQAEVFMAHGHGGLAVHLLQEHLRESPTESPVPWLLLLDLLHREGDVDGYAAASAECRRYFNINLAGHPISQESEPGPGLEAYPHLLEQLEKVWNTPDVDAFFNDLIYDNRGGTRMGFEPGAYRDILLLRAISQDVLPLAA